MKITICLFFILIKITFSQNNDNLYFISKINSFRINAGLERHKTNNDLKEIVDTLAYMYSQGEDLSKTENIKELFRNINLNISYYNYHRIKGNNSINNLFDYFINNYMKTILNEDYNYASFGIYNDGSYNYLVLFYEGKSYWVQIFLRD